MNRDTLASLPHKPGVYVFKNRENAVIYVGKAKDLKNRIRSYYRKSSPPDTRKEAMIRAVRDLEYTITGNEYEALVLEANLIKQYKPRFNILLRDDKSFPYLRLTVQEEWPRLEVVRRIQKDGAEYYGPFIPSAAMREILSFVRNTFPIRTCTHALDRRLRPCMQHQIGKCAAPCGGLIDHREYMQMIREIRLLLEGRNADLLAGLGEKMQDLSARMQYEAAARVRDRIRAIQKISETQKAIAPGLGDIDVIGLYMAGHALYFKMLFIRNGFMIGARHYSVRGTSGEPGPSVMKGFIEQFYSKERLLPKEVLCSLEPDDAGHLAAWLSAQKGSRVRILVPRRGLKRKLLIMAEENATALSRAGKEAETDSLLSETAEVLGLDKPLRSIGAFDISNIVGTHAVGAYITWADGDFRKEHYRRLRMDVVQGPDDYAMMKEMLKRIIGNHGRDLPDLIVLDGGKGHLAAGLAALRELGISGQAVIGIAKDPDRAFLPGRAAPMPLDDNSRPALLLRKIRDEAHRFAVGYHRNLRTKGLFASSLDAVPGIGRNRRFALLRHFDTIEAIKEASVEDIARIRGFNKKIAELLLRSLNK